VARLTGTGQRHARWRPLAEGEYAAAAGELRELAGGRADLLAEAAGIMEGASEGELDEPLRRQAAQLWRGSAILTATSAPGVGRGDRGGEDPGRRWRVRRGQAKNSRPTPRRRVCLPAVPQAAHGPQADDTGGTRWHYLLVSETDVKTAKGSWAALKGLGGE
jgi:hypothetical protein